MNQTALNDKITLFDFDVSLGVTTFPTKTIVIRLAADKDLVIAPGKGFVESYRPEERQVLVLTPNSFHHLFLGKFLEAFPQAKLFANPWIRKKQPALAAVALGVDQLRKETQGTLEIFNVEGNKVIEESVLWHLETKTLLLTDLLFHMQEPMPMSRKWILKMAGAYNRVAQSRLIKFTTKDRAAYSSSVDPIKKLEPKNIIMAHGKTITGESACAEALKLL